MLVATPEVGNASMFVDTWLPIINTLILFLGVIATVLTVNQKLRGAIKLQRAVQAHEIEMEAHRRLAELGSELLRRMQDVYERHSVCMDQALLYFRTSDPNTIPKEGEMEAVYDDWEKLRVHIRTMGFYTNDSRSERLLSLVQRWSLQMQPPETSDTQPVNFKRLDETRHSILVDLTETIPRVFRVIQPLGLLPSELQSRQEADERRIRSCLKKLKWCEENDKQSES